MERDTDNDVTVVNNSSFIVWLFEKLGLPYWRLLVLAMVTSFLSLANFGLTMTMLTIPVNLFLNFFNESAISQHHPISQDQSAILWGFTVSIPYGTALIGALMVVPVSKRYGRKYPLMLHSNIFVIIGAGICALTKYTNTYELLILGRCIQGIGIGTATTILPMYLIEISPVKHRGFIASLHGLCSGLSSVLGLFLSYSFALGTEKLWPILVGCPMIFAILQIVIMPLCPESPQYLYIATEEKQKAEQIIRVFYGPHENIADALELFREEAQLEDQKLTLLEAFKSFHIRQSIIIGCIAGMTQNLSAASVMASYITLAAENLGINKSMASTLTLIGASAAIPGVLIGPKVVSKFPRRTVLIGGLTLMEVCIIAAFTFDYIHENTGAMWASYTTVGFAIVIYAIYNFGPGPISWFIGAELCPEQARSIAAASNLIGVYSTALITQLLFPEFLVSFQSYTYLILFAIPNFVCIWLLFKFLPETNGRSMNQIVIELESRHRSIQMVTNRIRHLSQSVVTATRRLTQAHSEQINPLLLSGISDTSQPSPDTSPNYGTVPKFDLGNAK